MVELNTKKADELYDKIKKIFLSKNSEESYTYSIKYHNLYESEATEEIRRNFYNESGSVDFVSFEDKIITIEINRFHRHKHNGWSGLNSTPCCRIKIYEKETNTIIWELNVESATLYYKAMATSEKIPIDILTKNKKREKEILEKSFKALRKVVKKYQEISQNIEELSEKQENEINKTINQIKNKYREKLNEYNEKLNDVQSELLHQKDIIEKYSTFDIETISKAFIELIRIMHDEIFECQYVDHAIIENNQFLESNNIHLIIKREEKRDKYENNYIFNEKFNGEIIKQLVYNGNAITLPGGNNFDKKSTITFYEVNENGEICFNRNIFLEHFDYIKDFIDSMIEYRVENNMLEFNNKDILEYLKKYIIDNQEVIKSVLESRIKQHILKLGTISD